MPRCSTSQTGIPSDPAPPVQYHTPQNLAIWPRERGKRGGSLSWEFVEFPPAEWIHRTLLQGVRLLCSWPVPQETPRSWFHVSPADGVRAQWQTLWLTTIRVCGVIVSDGLLRTVTVTQHRWLKAPHVYILTLSTQGQEVGCACSFCTFCVEIK